MRPTKKMINSMLLILKNYQIKKAVIFGSYARDEANENSDVDVAIDYRGRMTLFDFVGLKIELQEQIGKKVDLTTFRALHPIIKRNALQGAIRIL